MAFSVAHLSDFHWPAVPEGGVLDFANKRLLGMVNLRLRRRRIHRMTVLDALLDKLAEVKPDHLAVTGDLAN
ncbi:metallophosphoesterase, partial [bacterium]|nr:metallophosphoesterase [bacterium]